MENNGISFVLFIFLFLIQVICSNIFSVMIQIIMTQMMEKAVLVKQCTCHALTVVTELNTNTQSLYELFLWYLKSRLTSMRGLLVIWGKDWDSYCQASYSPCPNTKVVNESNLIIINHFWKEFHNFQQKTGPFATFKGCFSMSDAVQGNSSFDITFIQCVTPKYLVLLLVIQHLSNWW